MSWASKPTKKRCHTNIGVEKEGGGDGVRQQSTTCLMVK